MNVVILAAGQGKRMNSCKPKVLHQLAGKPLLAHVIAAARALSPDKIVVVVGHGGNEVRRTADALDMEFALQSEQLGTGHALQQALPYLAKAETTLVLFGDVPLIRADTLRGLTAGKGVRILTAMLDNPKGYGRIVRKNKQVCAIVEEKDASAAQKKIREVNTGIMALPTARLAGWLGKLKPQNAQKEYYLTDIVLLALADRVAVSGVPATDVWETLGVNSKAQLAQLERHAQQCKANQLLEQGVTLSDPARVDVRGDLACGRDVSIDIGCIFEGAVTLADDVSVGAHCVLQNIDVKAGTRIEPYSHLVDAVIGANCRIGPYARIRPGTTLADDVHIGNFVEIKASDIGFGSKANHLAYIGDSSVGRNVNVGAGTITCNYDGANKHRTVIEDDVFIGSDTQLVAPVTVHRGATIGAGATITKDVAAGELAISRAKQISIAGWKRPSKAKKK
ncbi:MAG: bifunctional UDP-N-acetylglucosamine diphosphorylase/glucosamine-1-phosphate N-acetyltransferase GlmU [Burkholderiales bacterium]